MVVKMAISILEIQYRHTDKLRVEGTDVYYTVNIAPWEAALGQAIELNIPLRVQSK